MSQRRVSLASRRAAKFRADAVRSDGAFDAGAVVPSIDTPLHAFIPARHVDHTHPNAVIAIAALRCSRELTRQVFDDDVGWLPWMRPGMELALALERHVPAHPRQVRVVLGQHGLIDWADDGDACYQRTLTLIDCAARFIEAHDKGHRTFGGPRCEILGGAARDALMIELLPWLRERLSASGHMIATVQTDPQTIRFVSSVDAPRLAALGPSCPDHFHRTKIKRSTSSTGRWRTRSCVACRRTGRWRGDDSLGRINGRLPRRMQGAPPPPQASALPTACTSAPAPPRRQRG